MRAAASAAESPQVAAGEHVDERHERNQHEQCPGQLRALGYVGAGQQVDPDEDDREGMEKAEEKLDDLLHVPNLLDCGLAWSPDALEALMPDDVLNLRALNRALLARQMLLEPAPLPEGPGRAGAVIAMVEHLAGLQAQAPFPPYYGLWSRLAGFRPADLAELLVSRQVVRIALMRSTIHLVSARDCLMFRPLIQPALDRSL